MRLQQKAGCSFINHRLLLVALIKSVNPVETPDVTPIIEPAANHTQANNETSDNKKPTAKKAKSKVSAFADMFKKNQDLMKTIKKNTEKGIISVESIKPDQKACPTVISNASYLLLYALDKDLCGLRKNKLKYPEYMSNFSENLLSDKTLKTIVGNNTILSEAYGEVCNNTLIATDDIFKGMNVGKRAERGARIRDVVAQTNEDFNNAFTPGIFSVEAYEKCLL